MTHPTLRALGALAAAAPLLAGAAQAETDMSNAPAAQSAASDRIQRVTSPGGLEAWLVEEHAIPMVTIEIAFEGGTSLDPEGKSGAVSLAADLINDGAGDLDHAAFQDALDDTAAQIGADAARDYMSVSFKTLLRNADPSYELLRKALSAPRFDDGPFGRSQAQTVSNLEAEQTDPETRAARAFSAAMYPGDPYGRSGSGTLESVPTITPDDLRALWPQLTNLNGVYISVVGAISAEELAPLLDQIFGDLPRAPLPELSPAAVREAGGVIVLPEDVPQSTAYFGHSGILRDDPDFMIAYVMNHMLGGGGFTSRLMDQVREKNGLAYSIYSYLSPNARGGVYVGAVSTSNERISDSLALIRKIWRDMAETGVTEEELQAAKDYLTGAFALRFDSNAKIAQFLVTAQRVDLGIDYIDRRNELVEAVTVADVNRVAQRLLRADDLLIVVAGAPEGIEATTSVEEAVSLAAE